MPGSSSFGPRYWIFPAEARSWTPAAASSVTRFLARSIIEVPPFLGLVQGGRRNGGDGVTGHNHLRLFAKSEHQGRPSSLRTGSGVIGFDLSEAKFSNIDSSAHTATLQLPEPEFRRPRLDHEKTRIVAVWQSGLWRWAPGQGEVNREIINHALQQAQRSLQQPLTNDVKHRSEQRAREVIERFVKALGWRLLEVNAGVHASTMNN